MPSHPGVSVDPALRALGRLRRLHLHRYRWLRDDAFSGSSLYGCRCGSVRPGY
ncbi:hypothetical protein [Blastococcus sp. SYSU D00695]